MSQNARDIALAACRFLGDAASGRECDKDRLPEEAQLLGFAKVHRLTSLFGSALRSCGAGGYETLHTEAERAVFRQMKNDLAAQEAAKRITDSGVSLLPLKGAALQAVYPDGWVRTTTDTDWYVTSAQLETAANILHDMGFEQIASHDGDVCFQKPPRTVIELHTTLGGYSASQRQTLGRLSKMSFSVNEHYVYTLFHLYKHVLYAGAGVRMFFDMYCLSRAVTDRAAVDKWLDELGLDGFDRAVRTVCGVLFDGDDCPDAMCEAVDFALFCGTFGTQDSYYAMKRVSRRITHKSRVREWLDNYGFSRDMMVSRYPALERRLWLYPAFAVHRVLHGMMFRRKALSHVAKVERAADRDRADRVLRAMNIL